MQHHAADHLHVVMAHAKRALGRLAHHRKGLRQQFLQRLTTGNPLLELIGLAAQLVVAQLFVLGLQRIDAGNSSGKLAQYALVAATEQTRQGTIEHRSSGLGNRMPATGAGQSGILLHACERTARERMARRARSIG